MSALMMTSRTQPPTSPPSDPATGSGSAVSLITILTIPCKRYTLKIQKMTLDQAPSSRQGQVLFGIS
ncbi:Aryl-hydrocarbon-interacting protein-like 1 [Clarias magur]|uniref:Aryl-hydrocarbon-interacting protein-like 1 n=1 Tax=Clarias magur TaxID=1594786 RepID=A0A8J4U8F8_CLAMG|nr:Aryl-hydrocarbon-interacting protein-like 1 [Clarias magur]